MGVFAGEFHRAIFGSALLNPFCIRTSSRSVAIMPWFSEAIQMTDKWDFNFFLHNMSKASGTPSGPDVYVKKGSKPAYSI